jgi:hypothetical protein
VNYLPGVARAALAAAFSLDRGRPGSAGGMLTEGLLESTLADNIRLRADVEQATKALSSASASER